MARIVASCLACAAAGAADASPVAQPWIAPLAIAVALLLAALCWFLAWTLAATRRASAGASNADANDEHLRAILHTTQDLIYLIDGDGRVALASKSAKLALLATHDHLIGRPLRELPLPRAFIDGVERRRRDALDSGRSSIWDERVETPS